MDVTIVYKWEYEADDRYIGPDGTLKMRRSKLVASDDDAAAIASARALAEATGGTMHGATGGNGDASWAMARGAESAASLKDYVPASDDAVIAEELSWAVKAAGAYDVVAIGDAMEHAGVAALLAEQLNLPYVAGVRDFEADPDEPDGIIAHRAVDEGIETLKFKAPVLISVAAVDSETNVPSMKQMLAAKKAPVEKIDAEEPPSSAFSVTDTRKPEGARAKIFEGDPDTAAMALVEALRADGAL